jgi:hypothetical protein
MAAAVSPTSSDLLEMYHICNSGWSASVQWLPKELQCQLAETMKKLLERDKTNIYVLQQVQQPLPLPSVPPSPTCPSFCPFISASTFFS